MDTSNEVVSDMLASNVLEGSQKSDPTTQITKSVGKGIPDTVSSGNGVSDVTNDRLQQSPTPNSWVHEPQPYIEKNICMASVRNGTSDGHTFDGLQQTCSPDAKVHETKSIQEGTINVTPVSNEVASDKLRHSQSPNSRADEVEVSQEGIVPTTIPEKALEDGYNWRKYGQKHVKGNEFIRSYYKCTHPTCQVKKQVERSHEGKIMDTLCFGTHDHPKAQPISVAAGSVSSIQEEKTDEPLMAGAEDNSYNEQLEPTDTPKYLTMTAYEHDPRCADSRSNRIGEEVYNDEKLEPKRRKQDCHNVDATQADKQTGESRLVVQTTSEVDMVNDGYRWRKYGEKLLKGNPNPRSYYRCSNAGCLVKKHVERASNDPKVVITTYEGQHDHDMPPVRTVTPTTAGFNGESRAESEEIDIVGHEVIVQYSLDTESRTNECRRPDAELVHN